MELTEKQVYDLNNRNVASQNVQLGTILANKSGRALTEKEIYDLTNDNVVAQKIKFGEIINAIAIGDMTGIENLTKEEQEQLNNIDSTFQNVSIGNYIEEIIEGGEPPQPQENGYLTFRSTGNEGFEIVAVDFDGRLQYSNDTTNWTDIEAAGDVVTILANQQKEIYLRGIGNTYLSTDSEGIFIYPIETAETGEEVPFYCEGNIETLLDYQTVLGGRHPAMASNCYAYLFALNDMIVTPPKLPATTLTEGCYNSMFEDCSNLEKIPSLDTSYFPRTCCAYMFENCGKIELYETGGLTKEEFAIELGKPVYEYRLPKSGEGSGHRGPASWNVSMFSGTSGDVTRPNLNTIYYTPNEIV